MKFFVIVVFVVALFCFVVVWELQSEAQSKRFVALYLSSSVSFPCSVALFPAFPHLSYLVQTQVG